MTNPTSLFRGRPRLTDLTPREQATIKALDTLHVATAQQLARVVFGDASTPTSLRLTHRHLARLGQAGLIRSHPNPLPAHRAGRRDQVHVLSAHGLRTVGRSTGLGFGQRRSWHPSAAKLEHWLAIGDLYAQLSDAVRSRDLAIHAFAVESNARRLYQDEAGRPRSLQPDAYASVRVGDTIVSWFIEIDRGTENPQRIAQKCRAYREYELSDLEYQRHGVFPGVLFIVPDQQRLQAISRMLRQQPADARGLFWVATDTAAIATMLGPTS